MSKLYKSPCYCTNLRRSAKAVSGLYDNAFKKSGLSAPQYYLLINLSRLKSANITDWAKQVGLERSTMARNVKLLEKRGLIRLTEGHGKTFELSESGSSSLEIAVGLWEEAQKKLEIFLGEEDARAVLRIGAKLQSLDFEEDSDE